LTTPSSVNLSDKPGALLFIKQTEHLNLFSLAFVANLIACNTNARHRSTSAYGVLKTTIEVVTSVI
jgi:hypothetical protein